MSKVSAVPSKDKAFRDILNAVARGTKEGYSTLNFAYRTIRVQDNLNAICEDLEDLYGKVAEAHMVLIGDSIEGPAFQRAVDYFEMVVPDVTRALNRVRKNALRIAEFRRTGKVPRR